MRHPPPPPPRPNPLLFASTTILIDPIVESLKLPSHGLGHKAILDATTPLLLKESAFKRIPQKTK